MGSSAPLWGGREVSNVPFTMRTWFLKVLDNCPHGLKRQVDDFCFSMLISGLSHVFAVPWFLAGLHLSIQRERK